MKNRLEDLYGANVDEIAIKPEGGKGKFSWSDCIPPSSRFVSSFFTTYNVQMKALQRIACDLLPEFKADCEKAVNLSGKKRGRLMKKVHCRRKEISMELTSIRNYLSDLKKKIGLISQRKESDLTAANAEYRMKTGKYTLLVKKLALVFQEFQRIFKTLESNHRDESRRKMELMFDKGDQHGMLQTMNLDQTSKLFDQTLLGTSQLMAECQVALENKRQLLEIDANMTELVDMFMDLQIMVDAEQKTVDLIDNYVEESKASVRLGRENMRLARMGGKKRKDGIVKRLFKYTLKRVLFG